MGEPSQAVTRRVEQGKPPLCSFPGCPHEARGTYCEGHWKQRRDHGRLVGPVSRRQTDPDQALREAATGYSNADGDEEYERAKDRLRKTGLWTGEAALRRAAVDPVRDEVERRICAKAADVLRRLRRGSS